MESKIYLKQIFNDSHGIVWGREDRMKGEEKELARKKLREEN